MSAHRRHRCSGCGELYKKDLGPKRETAGECPTDLCWRKRTYGPDDWEGLARMAAARTAAGIELTDIDRYALEVCAR